MTNSRAEGLAGVKTASEYEDIEATRDKPTCGVKDLFGYETKSFARLNFEYRGRYVNKRANGWGHCSMTRRILPVTRQDPQSQPYS